MRKITRKSIGAEKIAMAAYYAERATEEKTAKDGKVSAKTANRRKAAVKRAGTD